MKLVSKIPTVIATLAALASFPSFAVGPANVLVIIADDLGVDMLAAYGEAKACQQTERACETDQDCAPQTCGSDFPQTPHIDNLIQNGIGFRNAWSNPVCSPTRATILTGRYGLRTGVGAVVGLGAPGLPPQELTIPEVLDMNPGLGYTHAAFGKWHLGGGESGPCDHGFSQYAGALFTVDNYTMWGKTLCPPPPGAPATQTELGFATAVNVDDAIAWIGEQGGPWFLWLAFNAPHGPFEAPPGRQCQGARACYLAMIEAMDAEIGRLLGTIDLNTTTVIFLGDNGTPRVVTAPPFDPNHAKNTVYEGGVNVPLVISGAGVTPRTPFSDALVNMSDLFATILELTGAPLPSDRVIDSTSLVPVLDGSVTGSLREFVFTERFGSIVPREEAILNQRADGSAGYKLIRRSGPVIELYDLLADPFEKIDLIVNPPEMEREAEAQANLEALLTELDQIECGCHLSGDPAAVKKNRYLSFIPAYPGHDLAIRVTLLESLPQFGGFEGEVRWVGPPFDAPDPSSGADFKTAALQCEPHLMDWSSVGLLHVFGDEVVPSSRYEISVEGGCGCVLTVETGAWGDVVAPFAGETTAPQPSFNDISAAVAAFEGAPGAIPKVSAQLTPNVPNPCELVSFRDIAAVVDGFLLKPYDLSGPQACPKSPPSAGSCPP